MIYALTNLAIEHSLAKVIFGIGTISSKKTLVLGNLMLNLR